jgi:ribonuclease HI
MLKAKEMQITLSFGNTNLHLNRKGNKIADLLGNNFTRKVALALEKLKLIYIEQLINKSDNQMISWRQLKLLRGLSCKGKQAEWFSKIEEKLIENKQNRRVERKWQTQKPNVHALEIQLEPCSEDRRKKEWVFVKLKKKEKEKEEKNSEPFVKRVIASTRKKALTEHWKQVIEPESLKVFLNKCKNCSLNQKIEEGSCSRWENKSEIQGSISKFVRKHKDPILDLSYEMFAQLGDKGEATPTESERKAEYIQCMDLETEIIQKQSISQAMKIELIRKKDLNQENLEDTLVFYTDGSLKKDSKKGISSPDRMGAGWLQVDTKEEIILDEGYFGVRNWPSSTRPELLAIWYVLLTVPSRKKVKIYTDSATAIANIKGKNSFLSAKQRLKRKNFNILENIRNSIELKELKLELVKVKGHSNSK